MSAGERSEPLLHSTPYAPIPPYVNTEKLTLKTRWNVIKSDFLRPLPPAYDTKFGVGWITLVSLIVMWNATTIPLRIGFRQVYSRSGLEATFIIIDYIGDIFLFIDIYLNFRFSFMRKGFLVENQKEIVKHYLRTWFLLDFPASIPFSFFTFQSRYHEALRIPKLLRMARVTQHLDQFNQTTYNTWIQLFKLLTTLVLVAHYIACAYMGLSYHEGFGDDWTPPEELLAGGFGSHYQFGFFKAMSMITRISLYGVPANETERTFMLFVMIVAVFLIAVIIGKVTEIIGSINMRAKSFSDKMSTINRFMTNRKIPKPLRKRVQEYYRHMWSYKGGIDHSQILDELPSSLRTDVCRFLHRDILRKAPLFERCSSAFVDCLVRYLKPQIFAPGDWIALHADRGEEMYFLNQGRVEIISPSGQVLLEREEGSILGEIALLVNTRRMASIRAVTWCDMVALEKADFLGVLDMFPKDRAIIQEITDVRLAYQELRLRIRDDVFFKGCSPAFLTECVSRFTSYQLEAGQAILPKGPLKHAVFFLGSGTWEIARGPQDNWRGRMLSEVGISQRNVQAPPDPSELSTRARAGSRHTGDQGTESIGPVPRSTPKRGHKAAQAGTFFGMASLLLEQARTEILIAKTKNVVYCLTRDEYMDVTETFPVDKGIVLHNFGILRTEKSDEMTMPMSGSIPRVTNVTPVKRSLAGSMERAPNFPKYITNALRDAHMDQSLSESLKRHSPLTARDPSPGQGSGVLSTAARVEGVEDDHAPGDGDEFRERMDQLRQEVFGYSLQYVNSQTQILSTIQLEEYLRGLAQVQIELIRELRLRGGGMSTM